MMQKIIPFIWFEGQAKEAMNFYASTFPDSKITHIERYTGDMGVPGEKELKGKILTGIFEIKGQQLMCLDGPSGIFKSGGNISLLVHTDSQDELDKIWDKLLDGGKPQQCGWISDKFGVTWQIVPQELDEMMTDPKATEAQKKAVMDVMMLMIKLDGPKLRKAFEKAK